MREIIDNNNALGIGISSNSKSTTTTNQIIQEILPEENTKKIENSEICNDSDSSESQISSILSLHGKREILPEDPNATEEDVLQSAKIFYSDKNNTFIIYCRKCDFIAESVPLFIAHYCSKENPNYVPQKEFKQISVEEFHKGNELKIGDDDLWHCRTCTKAYEKRSILRKHEQHHLNVFPCEICGKKLKKIVSYREHMDTHLGNKPFVCIICSKEFARKWVLISHIRYHLGDFMYSCKTCEKEFANGTKLQLHLRMVHTNEKPFMCDICEKDFYSKTMLQEHKRRHDNNRTFKCDQCDKAFFYKHHLASHLIKHSNERPFLCNLCPAKFSRKKTLECHLRTHSGVKDFLCPLCGNKFVTNANLLKHLEGHKKGTLVKKARDPNVPIRRRPLTSKVSKILAELIKTDLSLEEQQKSLIASLREAGGAISSTILNLDSFREQVMKAKEIQKQLETPRPPKKPITTKKLSRKKPNTQQQEEDQLQHHQNEIIQFQNHSLYYE